MPVQSWRALLSKAMSSNLRTEPVRPVTRVFLCHADTLEFPPDNNDHSHILGKSERERLSRYQGRRYREFLQSRLLLRHALSATLPGRFPPAHWQITERPEQPPLIHQAAEAGWYYSLSHSRGMIAVMISNSGFCGIDLEYQRHRANMAELAEQWFHPDEAALLAALTNHERTGTFYRLWTMKEAFIKATDSSVFSGILARIRFTPSSPRDRGQELCTHHLELPTSPFSLSVVCRLPPTGIFLGYPVSRAEVISPRVTSYTIHQTASGRSI